MGKRVVLAPRNGAEALALGVSACFLAVAGVVVQGSPTLERTTATTTQNLAAQVQDVRTVSRPSPMTQIIGSRLPSVLLPEPPLVLLPVADQARAKIAAAGTRGGDGAVLVAWSRGAGTLSVGGGITGVAPPPLASAHPNGAVGFPVSTSAPSAVTAAPSTHSRPTRGPSQGPTQTTPVQTSPAGPTATTPVETTTTPTTPVETNPAPTTPVEPTPTPVEPTPAEPLPTDPPAAPTPGPAPTPTG